MSIVQYDTLYKRTSTGKIQIWYMEREDNRYRSTSGQLGGKAVTSEWTIAQAKNVGRANATTPTEQAIAEIEAEYDKKLARDYRKTTDTVDELDRFKPMLATKWKDRAAKIPSGTKVFIQPKYDGIRCVLNANGMWSREGKPLLGSPHIFQIVKNLYADFFANNPSLIFDGELYNHDFKDDFNKIVSAVKKQKPSPSDLKDAEQIIQYHIYDVPSMASSPFSVRFDALKQNWSEHKSIVLSPTDYIDVSEVNDRAAQFIEDGYEGAMVRLDEGYENKRSSFLMKWKEFQDEEFPIVDVQEGDGNRSGMAARVVLALRDGRTFSAGVIGNFDYCRQLLRDKDSVIGLMGTVVFQNYTPDGVPRFPKFKAVRYEGM